eukprot:CAMPEP_0202457586 /NCGR_PEP_ID=MMETSP1360-20130828/14577_1 /ASSEMBLY_ACC=CAM_ASM_000848 /TAXON_ID=515479 /ORGANISM="Licmophora paradoxa, Strain CCMP2313" /LENGTH=357 /DNA_ID=CAMNT_0049077725 /DNA_START=161 /DNA_END=1234 /DNA_ORIENTATION=+
MPSCSLTAPRVEIEDILKEQEELNESDRIRITEEIKGISSVVDETDGFLRGKLDELRDEFTQDEKSSLPAYFFDDKDSEYALMFLRRENYDPKKASRKMISYFQSKKKYFGLETALKPRVSIHDLQDGDLDTVRNGGMFVLPSRDRSGRSMLISNRENWVYTDRQAMARLWIYLGEYCLFDHKHQQQQQKKHHHHNREQQDCAAEGADYHSTVDPASSSAPYLPNNSQVRGIVCILHDSSKYDLWKHHDRKLDKILTDLYHKSMPLTVSCMHIWLKGMVWQIAVPFLLFLFGREIRQHVQTYKHNNDKCIFIAAMKEQGINTEDLPKALGGDLVIDFQQVVEDMINSEEDEFETKAQ